jgi:hypothetical protein
MTVGSSPVLYPDRPVLLGASLPGEREREIYIYILNRRFFDSGGGGIGTGRFFVDPT